MALPSPVVTDPANPDPSPGPTGDPADGAADAPAGRPSDADDDALLAACATDLADAVDRAIVPWVRAAVARLADAWASGSSPRLDGEAARAGEAARVEVGGAVRRLLALDVDEQPTGPLDLLRGLVAYPTGVLEAAGVPPVQRDDFAEATFPHDRYDLTPGSFRDLGDEVHEAGLRWGAAKAHRVLARRRAEGLR